MTDRKHTTSDLDRFWKELACTVAAGNFAAYSNHYHEDAVYVSALSGECHPIKQALLGWQDGFAETRAGRRSTNVQFRFTQRLHNADTAHVTGIFCYTSHEGLENPVVLCVHFEALLVRKNDWKILMEYQKESATEAQWAQLG